MGCRRKIRENITLSVVSKLVMIALALTGYSTLWFAIIADVGAMLVVTFNGMAIIGFGKDDEATLQHGHAGGCCGHDHSHGHGHGNGHADSEVGWCGHDHGSGDEHRHDD